MLGVRTWEGLRAAVRSGLGVLCEVGAPPGLGRAARGGVSGGRRRSPLPAAFGCRWEVDPETCLEAVGSMGHVGGALPSGLCLPGFAYRVHFASVEEGVHYA